MSGLSAQIASAFRPSLARMTPAVILASQPYFDACRMGNRAHYLAVSRQRVLMAVLKH